jgi:hypothetical protein
LEELTESTVPSISPFVDRILINHGQEISEVFPIRTSVLICKLQQGSRRTVTLIAIPAPFATLLDPNRFLLSTPDAGARAVHTGEIIRKADILIQTYGAPHLLTNNTLHFDLQDTFG